MIVSNSEPKHQMERQQVLNCSFSKWFPLFSDVSIQSEVIKLSDDFIEYLLSDGIVLPKSSEVDVYGANEASTDDQWSEDEAETDTEVPVIEFPLIEQRINEVLDSYGQVFPKLNWSSCEDAKWISASGTRCHTSQDIYLLLKSSDRVVHDLTQPFKHCCDDSEDNPLKVEYELVLKKWVDINPSMEFRCFVVYNTLIGISQRDVRSHYAHIGQQKDEIIEDIKHFFDIHVKNKFFDIDFVIDVYRPDSGRVVLLDFNPFGETTDSLLFDWDELNGQSWDVSQLPEFRYISSEAGIQAQVYSMNSVPIDVQYGYSLTDLVDNCHIDR